MKKFLSLEYKKVTIIGTLSIFAFFIINYIPIFAQIETNTSEVIEQGKSNITISPPRIESNLASPFPQELSDTTLNKLEERTEKSYEKPIIPLVNETITPPPNGSEIQSSLQSNIQKATINIASLSSVQDKDFNLYINKSVTASPSKSVVGEPAVANNGSTIFYTGNWYAAKSNDNGSTWSFLSPLNKMNDFCCDQDIVYDKNHDIFIWYRQGAAILEDPNDLDSDITQRIVLSISSDGEDWWSYDISPTDLSPSFTNQWFDYPHLALSDNYLYFTSNIFNKNDIFVQSVIVRIPLVDLASGNSPTIDYYGSNSVFTFTPVQGATNIMYWGSHQDNSHMAVYKWPEFTSTDKVEKKVIAIDSWNLQPPFVFKCKTDQGFNWCKRSDSRITNGWIIGNQIGFFWNVQQGGTFNLPHVEAAVFETNNMTYKSRPLLWSKDFAILYAYAYPSANAQLGLLAAIGGGKINPTIVAAVNGKNGHFEPWNLIPLINGTNSPLEEKWGDYKRVRAYDNSTDTWIASGFTLQGGITKDFIEPRVFVYGVSDNSSPSSILDNQDSTIIKQITYQNEKKR